MKGEIGLGNYKFTFFFNRILTKNTRIFSFVVKRSEATNQNFLFYKKTISSQIHHMKMNFRKGLVQNINLNITKLKSIVGFTFKVGILNFLKLQYLRKALIVNNTPRSQIFRY